MKRSGRTRSSFGGLLLLLASLGAASACPVCDTETGNQVRAGIFCEGFGWNVLAVLAPVPVLLLSACAVANWLGKEESRL